MKNYILPMLVAIFVAVSLSSCVTTNGNYNTVTINKAKQKSERYNSSGDDAQEVQAVAASRPTSSRGGSYAKACEDTPRAVVSRASSSHRTSSGSGGERTQVVSIVEKDGKRFTVYKAGNRRDLPTEALVIRKETGVVGKDGKLYQQTDIRHPDHDYYFTPDGPGWETVQDESSHFSVQEYRGGR